MVRLRGDIEGLRAIAVLAVVVHHAFPTWLPGGFLGVDVFFVISGYVIASALLASAENDALSLRQFYARRIRRIFPPLLLVLAAVVAVGWHLLTAEEFAQMSAQVAAAGVFGNNVLLWAQTGYFDAAAATQPLLHLWSLGVEEQFYLVLPALLWLLRARLRTFARVVLVAAALSYGAWVLSCELAPASGFYLLHARFWELAAGVLLACAHRGWLDVPGAGRLDAAARWLAPLALLMLGASFLLFHDGAWPHPLGVVPVAATALLLHLNRQRHDPVLANAPMARVGGVSYAFYLWHWPALVYWRMQWPDAAGEQLLVPVVGALLLALATQALVETPVRFGRLATRAWVPRWLAAALVLTAGAGLAAHLERGFPARFADEVLASQQPGAEAQAAWRNGRCFFYPGAGQGFVDECFWDDPAATVVIWGDSHAAHLYPGMRAVWSGSAHVAQLTAAGCPPTLRSIPGERPGNCARLRAQALDRLRQSPPATVVLTAFWRHYTDARLPDAELVRDIGESAQLLKSWGVKEIVVIGPGPTWRSSLPASVHRFMQQHDLREAPVRFEGMDDRTLALDAALAAGLRAYPVRYVSALALLCQPAGCAVRDPRSGPGEFFYFDQEHLTKAGSIHFARQLAGLLGR